MSVAQAQRRNPEMVALLSADFQNRYEPNFAWKSVCSLYESLPCLRVFYPMSIQNNAGGCRDYAGGLHMTAAGAPLFGYEDLSPYVAYGGAADAHYVADTANLDITGTEANVVAAQRGLTLGCWFKPIKLAAWQILMAKHTTAGDQRSYQLGLSAATGFPYFTISRLGTAATEVVVAGAVAPGIGVWSLLIARFVPATTMSICLNGRWDSLAVGVPASIFNSSAELNIGAGQNHTLYWFGGKISMAFMCAAALSDSIITAIWQQTRAMYGR